MIGREKILSVVAKNKPAAISLPDLDFKSIDQPVDMLVTDQGVTYFNKK